ncbi:alpha/beta-hydrolase, putative [Rhizoctonia solani AG-3 Rhs1AP]|uniref:Alpha/beta-hydrolase, putative n=1 Tax=Rhizoctonia solani AG-3 Rhs1AP TaxID=1086054 RepID=X8JJQ9_9AGAM|nr:alpha/beta-hydrolase, putative [Rhizoctonia solani AG-3 Rhs1AP]
MIPYKTSSFGALFIYDAVHDAASLSIPLARPTLYITIIALAFSLIALVGLVVVSTKPETHPLLGGLRFTKGSRLAQLKTHAQELYPIDFYGPGHSIRLTKGCVQYWLIGPEEGVKVVLIHGLTTPSLVWKYITGDLVDAGFRVLRL